RADIDRQPGVIATSPMVSGAAITVRGGGANAVVVQGIEPESYLRIIPLDSFVVAGRLDLDGRKGVIGEGLAKDLGVGVGDRVRLRVGTDDGARTGAPAGRATGREPDDAASVYTVSGLLDVGNADLNERWVFASLRVAQALFGLEGGASTIQVKV